MPRKPAAKRTAAKEERKPYAFDAEIYLNPDPGGIKTDAGGRPMTDKGGRPLTKDS